MASGLELAKAYVQIIPTTEGIQGELSRAMSSAASSAGDEAGTVSGNSFSGAFSSVLKGAAGVAKAVVGVVATATTAAAAFGASSVKAGQEFDAAMSQVAATMGKSNEQLQSEIVTVGDFTGTLRDFAQEMGSKTAFSATQAAEALNYMALAGYDAETSVSMLPNVLNLAAAGGIDLGYASDMVTDASSALGLSIEETAQMVDKMATTSSKSNTSVAQLGEAILTVGGTAKMMAGGTTELSAALGILADNGTKGAEGGTALRNILLSLGAPTDKASDALNSLGVAVYDSEGNMRPLKDTIADLNNAMSDMTDAEKTNIINTIFNKADLKNVNALLATSADRWDELGAAIDSASSLSSLSTEKLNWIVEELQYNFGRLGDTTEFQTEMLDYISNEYDLTASMAEDAINQFLESAREGTVNVDELVKSMQSAKGSAQEMAEVQLDNLQGDITLFQSALEGAKIAISDKLTPTLREFVQFGSDGLSKITEAFNENGLNGAMEAFGTLLTDGLQMIVQVLPQLTEAGMELIKALLTGISDNLPLILDAAIEIIGMIGKGFIEELPLILDAAMQIILTVAEGIAQALPELLPTIIEVVKQIALFLINNIPLLIDAAINLMLGLADGLMKAIPEIIKAIPEIISALLNALLGSIPQLIEAGIKLFVALIEDLPTIIAAIVEALPQIIEAVITAIMDNLPLLIDAGVKLFIALVENLPLIIATIVKAIPQIITGIVNAFKNAWPQLKQSGQNLITQLGIGIIAMKSALQTKVNEIKNSVINWFKELPGKIKEVGSNLITGLWEGLNDKLGWLKEKISSFTSSVLDAIKGFFGVHSPSKETAWIGEMLDLGLANGISDYAKNVIDEATQMSNEVMGAFNSINTDIGSGLATVSNTAAGQRGNEIEQLYNLLAKYLPYIAERPIVLDSGAVVSGTVKKMNKALGELANKTEKGCIV